MTKRTLLFLAVCFIIFLLTNVGFYGTWFQDRIVGTYVNLSDQLDNMSLDYRMQKRLGGSYIASVNVTRSLKNRKLDNVVLLLPPPTYLKRHGSNIAMPEPIVFYYFTGYRSVQCNSSDMDKANFAILILGKKFVLRPIDSKATLNTILAIYNS